MNKAEFDHWLEILRRNFPEHPMLKEAYRSWYPSNASQPPEIALSPIQVRPTEVVTATGLLSLSLTIGVVKLILAWRLINSAGDDGIDFPFALSTLIFALNVLFIWKIWQGRNWARVTLLVVCTIGALDMVTALLSTPGFHVFAPLPILQIVQLAICACALLLIFGPRSRQWFRPKETQSFYRQ